MVAVRALDGQQRLRHVGIGEREGSVASSITKDAETRVMRGTPVLLSLSFAQRKAQAIDVSCESAMQGRSTVGRVFFGDPFSRQTCRLMLAVRTGERQAERSVSYPDRKSDGFYGSEGQGWVSSRPIYRSSLRRRCSANQC